MRKERLTASESYELASIVRSIGVRNVLTILRNAAKPKKRKSIYKFDKLPFDVRAMVAVMIFDGGYSQKEMLNYINVEIDKKRLDSSLKVSKTSFNRYLNEIVYPVLPRR